MRARVTRGVAVAAAVAVVAVAAVAVVAVGVARWWQGGGGTYAPRRVLVHTSVTPTRSLFGQPLTATVRVVVDPARVDPGSVAVTTRFAPFAVRDERDDVRHVGRADVLSFAYTLQCLSAGCLPRPATGRSKGAATAFQLHVARVTARRRDGRAISVAARWPVFGVQSRLTAQDIAYSQPQIEAPLSAPAVTWRASPALLAALASALAALLVVGAGGLLASAALRDGRPLRALRIPRNLTPVERALRLAEFAARRGETDESRRALERLAIELRRRGETRHAAEAERLAWSQLRPTESTVAELAGEVRSNGAR